MTSHFQKDLVNLVNGVLRDQDRTEFVIAWPYDYPPQLRQA